jgi:hypothetical protein
MEETVHIEKVQAEIVSLGDMLSAKLAELKEVNDLIADQLLIVKAATDTIKKNQSDIKISQADIKISQALIQVDQAKIVVDCERIQDNLENVLHTLNESINKVSLQIKGLKALVSISPE